MKKVAIAFSRVKHIVIAVWISKIKGILLRRDSNCSPLGFSFRVRILSNCTIFVGTRI